MISLLCFKEPRIPISQACRHTPVTPAFGRLRIRVQGHSEPCLKKKKITTQKNTYTHILQKVQVSALKSE